MLRLGFIWKIYSVWLQFPFGPSLTVKICIFKSFNLTFYIHQSYRKHHCIFNLCYIYAKFSESFVFCKFLFHIKKFSCCIKNFLNYFKFFDNKVLVRFRSNFRSFILYASTTSTVTKSKNLWDLIDIFY